MNDHTINIRLMKADDLDAVVGIDERVLKSPRPEYYDLKFDKLFTSGLGKAGGNVVQPTPASIHQVKKTN